MTDSLLCEAAGPTETKTIGGHVATRCMESFSALARMDRWAGQVAAALSCSVAMSGEDRGVYHGIEAHGGPKRVAVVGYDMAEALENERTRRMKGSVSGDYAQEVALERERRMKG